MRQNHTRAVALLASAGLLLMWGCATRQKPAVAEYERPESLYNEPLVSPGTKFAALPPAVQHTIRAQTGGAEIEDIIRDTFSGRPIYRVYFTARDVLPPLYIAADGSVLNPDLTVAVGAGHDAVEFLTGGASSGIKLGDLPPDVVKLIQQRAPEAEIKTITKETRGDRVWYIISFKNEKQQPLEIPGDGAIVVPNQSTRAPGGAY